MDAKYRNLTTEEIRALSLELKICYYLCGWNKSFNPKNFDEWADSMFIYFYNEIDKEKMDFGVITKEDYKKRCIENAREEYNRLYDFIDRFIV